MDIKGIEETEYVFKILHPAGERPYDLSAAFMVASTGNGVGALTSENTQPVPPNEVVQRLVDLGNDGTFFDGYA